jgi:hypothetical protein
VIDINDILNSIKPRMRDSLQETRIRELYDRTYAAYQTDRMRGIKTELESDWNKLKTKFDSAIEKVKRETGLF